MRTTAGVELYEYRLGLLHAKTMLVDRAVGLIGSANLDRRSFERYPLDVLRERGIQDAHGSTDLSSSDPHSQG